MKYTKILLISLLFSGNTLAGSGAKWSYTGDTGPEFWGDLSPEYSACKNGLEQSPIDISFAHEAESLSSIKLAYKAQPLTVKNNGHAIQVDVTNNSKLKIGGDVYRLLQFHFHTPSENTINGRQYPLEAHFVHVNDAGQLAVFGVLYDEGAANKELQKIVDNSLDYEGSIEVPGTKVKMNKLAKINSTSEYFTFDGSLTTPPCTEGVRWFVSSKIKQASLDQIDVLHHSVHGSNSRPVQPLNNRNVFFPED